MPINLIVFTFLYVMSVSILYFKSYSNIWWGYILVTEYELTLNGYMFQIIKFHTRCISRNFLQRSFYEIVHLVIWNLRLYLDLNVIIPCVKYFEGYCAARHTLRQLTAYHELLIKNELKRTKLWREEDFSF